MPKSWLPLWLLALGALACSAPDKPTLTDRPAANHVPPPYIWPDSLPRYFPAQAWLNPNRIQPGDTARIVPMDRLLDCRYEYEFAGQCLAAFQAPVLATAPVGLTAYRFIWLRSFHQPALLTLERTATGGLLHTVFLNKSPGMTVPSLAMPDDSADMPLAGQQALRKFQRRKLADSAAMRQFRAAVAFAKAPVRVLVKKPVLLTAAQFQEFEKLVAQSGYWQLTGCEYSGVLDGAYWFLEAREAGRYHVVYRHSPGEQDKFRQCCEFLLDLSPARREERY